MMLAKGEGVDASKYIINTITTVPYLLEGLDTANRKYLYTTLRYI
jgi:hypothetical protein